MTKYKRFENESDDELIYRICKDKDKIGTWNEVKDILNMLLGNTFNESTYRKRFQTFEKMFDANQKIFADNEDTLKEIKDQIRELKKERYKIQAEKLELNQWNREEARDELITEKIVNAISNLTPLKIPDYIGSQSKKSGLLAFTDCHFGIEFCIKDMFGNVINEYSPEIFERRMWDMLNKLIPIIANEELSEIHVWELGDSIAGLLRLNSQLMNLRYGVIDSAIKYAEFLSLWLTELSYYVKIKFQMVKDSNHNQLRLLGQPKNSFPDENMSKVILTFIKERLKDKGKIELLLKIKDIIPKLKAIEEGEVSLDSEYNFEYSSWSDDEDEEYYFLDPEDLLYDVQEAISLVHKCIDMEMYKEGLKLVNTLYILDIRVTGDYEESINDTLELSDLYYHKLLFGNYVELQKEALYLTYMSTNIEDRAQELFSIFESFNSTSISLASILQMGNNQLPDFNLFG